MMSTWGLRCMESCQDMADQVQMEQQAGPMVPAEMAEAGPVEMARLEQSKFKQHKAHR